MNAADGKLRAARLDGDPSAAPAHTPEPWQKGRLLDTPETLRWSAKARMDAAGEESRRLFVNFSESDQGRSREYVAEFRREADANRARACVNALAGVSDPAAVRALVAAAREACDALHLAYFEVLRSRGSASGDDEASDRAASEPAVVALSRALAAFPDGAK